MGVGAVLKGLEEGSVSRKAKVDGVVGLGLELF